MKSKIKILYIDDNPLDKALVRDALEREHGGFELTEAANRKEFEKLLSEQKFDLVLSDFNILGYEGLQVIDYIKTNYSEIPIIIVTGTGSEETAVEAMKRSASDYIIKSPRHIKKLPHSIKKAIQVSRLQKSQEIISHISNAVLKTYTLSEFIQFIKKETGRLIDTSNFFVALYDETSNTFELPYYHDAFDNVETFPAEKTISHYVAKTQKSLLAKLDDLIRLEKKGIIKRIGTDSLVWMGIPLKIEDKVTGVMVAQSYTDPNAYDTDDLELLEIISATISLAIHNKKKEEELKDVNKLLSARNKELKEKIHEIEKYADELKKSKEKAEESDRLKSAFLANISHEIRTPMNGILGFAELLKEPKLTGEQQRQYINIINKSGRRMLNIINDIVQISKIESGQEKLFVSEVNINEQVDFIYKFFKPEAENKGLQLKLKTPTTTDKLILKTDREKLYSILTNLVKNAIKYTDSGSIEIGYKIEENKKQSFVEFYVSDTGIGIPKDRQKAIFERFVQADIEDRDAREGAGLGLAITKAYVELMGGKISVDSMEGKGSVFSFTLPCSSVKNIKKATSINIPHNDITIEKKLNILVAEDDETSLQFLSVILKSISNKILKAANGAEAVEICKQHPDIDIILLDIQMPVMNGYEATRQIRQFNPDVVIIAQTAFALPDDEKKVKEAGCNGYISKPIKTDKLLSIIKELTQPHA